MAEHTVGWVAVAVAIIAAIGGWGTAAITNWDKLWPEKHKSAAQPATAKGTSLAPPTQNSSGVLVNLSLRQAEWREVSIFSISTPDDRVRRLGDLAQFPNIELRPIDDARSLQARISAIGAGCWLVALGKLC